MPWGLHRSLSRHLHQLLLGVLRVLLGLLRGQLRRVHRVFLMRELLLQWLLGVFGRLRPGLRFMLWIRMYGMFGLHRLWRLWQLML